MADSNSLAVGWEWLVYWSIIWKVHPSLSFRLKRNVQNTFVYKSKFPDPQILRHKHRRLINQVCSFNNIKVPSGPVLGEATASALQNIIGWFQNTTKKHTWQVLSISLDMIQKKCHRWCTLMHPILRSRSDLYPGLQSFLLFCLSGNKTRTQELGTETVTTTTNFVLPVQQFWEPSILSSSRLWREPSFTSTVLCESDR